MREVIITCDCCGALVERFSTSTDVQFRKGYLQTGDMCIPCEKEVLETVGKRVAEMRAKSGYDPRTKGDPRTKTNGG